MQEAALAAGIAGGVFLLLCWSLRR